MTGISASVQLDQEQIYQVHTALREIAQRARYRIPKSDLVEAIETRTGYRLTQNDAVDLARPHGFHTRGDWVYPALAKDAPDQELEMVESAARSVGWDGQQLLNDFILQLDDDRAQLETRYEDYRSHAWRCAGLALGLIATARDKLAEDPHAADTLLVRALEQLRKVEP